MQILNGQLSLYMCTKMGKIGLIFFTQNALLIQENFAKLCVVAKIARIYSPKMVTYVINSQAVSWPGIELRTVSCESDMLTTKQSVW